MRKLLAAVVLLVFAAVAWAQSLRVAETSTSSVIYDQQNRCLLAVSNGALASNIICQNNALLYRTDNQTWYQYSAGSWSTATIAAQTLTTATITTLSVTTVNAGATIASPVVTGNASSGILVTKRCTITETSATSYTCSVTIPAGAVIEDIQVIGRVLWNGTSASMDVGDTADPNGYFDTIDLKATDLVIGEMLSVKHSTLWGGQEGAYIVAVSGRRGPTTSNFSMSYVAGSAITFVVTEGDATGTAGRTDCVVIYSTPETVAVS